jgi:Ca-activated chloride channel family protein
MRCAWLVSVLAVALLLPAGSARAGEGVRSGASPYFFVEGADPGVDALPLESTRVEVNVSGVIADVVVTQVYANEGGRPLHARYVFPASTRAAVHGMRIRVGDRAVIARVKEKQQASQEFEVAKQAGKTASLLDQERPNVFGMSVANILPGDEVEVELRYSEMLVPSHGVYELVYPTVVGPRYVQGGVGQLEAPPQLVANPHLRAGTPPSSSFDLTASVSTGIPLLDLGCDTHDTDVDWQGETRARVTLAERSLDGGNRDFILRYRLAGERIQSGLLLHDGEQEDFFLLMVEPPASVALAQIPPREYVFILDVSGSMHGFPLDTAKRTIANLLSGLRWTDRFNVVLFSGASRVLAPTSLDATPQNIERAAQWIAREGGGGGTELSAALAAALALPRAEHVSRTVAVVTDGFIAEEESAFALIAANLSRTNFFAFGIGSSVNRHLIEGMARAGQGEPFIVTNPADADAVAERFRRYVEAPLLTDVRVRFDGFDAYDVEPPAQPDLFAERPIAVFGKWRGARTGRIEVSGRTGDGAFVKTFEVAGLAPRPDHAALPRLWARSRIARLSDFRFQERDVEAVREVTALGLGYSLLTRYTSFIAVLERVRNPGGDGAEVKQALPLPAGVSDLAVGYGSAAEPEIDLLAACLAALLGCVLLRRRLVRPRGA